LKPRAVASIEQPMRNPFHHSPLPRLALLFLALLGFTAPARALDASVQQLIVSTAPGWDSQNGHLQLFGKGGLAWGRGVLGTDEPGTHKTERDKRAPAGVFRIGTIYTYDAALPEGSDFRFHTVTTRDAWVDDPTSPDYNKHVAIPDPANPPPWFEKQKMRHNDFAYRWLVEIRHNSDPPVAGEGSAIFFHIRRGADRPSAGCTTMAEPNLVKLIRWLRVAGNPHYALLPKTEYLRKWQAWGLPSPQEAVALLGEK
jgi:L,D-peptidoglycan transpeptidase YkuD (ErfK/YbiS/YcfS/YnhG family)